MLKLARRLSIAAAVGMFIVLLMGALVTKTGSGMGCGRSWPLCNGEFIPSYTIETAIEYSHRLVTSVEGLLLVGACATAFRFRKALPELKVLIPVTLFTLVLQSGMGALAVIWPQSPWVLATHFGISMTAVASTALMARVLGEGPDRPPRNPYVVPRNFIWATWGLLLLVTVIAYMGAYVRHSKASLACASWPLCNGKVLSGLTLPEGVVVAHRIAALIGLVVIVVMWRWAATFTGRPDLGRIGLIATVIVVVQAMTGALVPLTQLSFWSTMTHAGLMALLFVVCTEWCRLAMPQPTGKPSKSAAESGMPLASSGSSAD